MATCALATLASAPRACSLTSSRGRAARSSRRPLTSRASAGAASDPESEPASETPPAASFSVVVFGANGKTGKRCVAQAAAAGARVVACSRAGDFATSGLTNASLVETRAGDVAKASDEALRSIVRGSDAAIFAASASPSGGTPQEVDKAGLVKVAAACVAENVKRLVIVSSGSVSKPLSPVYVFLNFFGGVMRAKIEGEDAVRAMYVARDGCDYVVVRPGGLTEDPARGAGAMELNQGDEKSGRVSREDVAAICVAAAKAAGTELARNATFECYWVDTANDLRDVGVSNALGMFSGDDAKAPIERTGKECRGETWVDLLDGLEPDRPGEAQQGWGPSL